MPKDVRNTLAIVGARGLLAEALLQQLADRPRLPEALHLLDSGEAVGETLNYGNRELQLGDAQTFDFASVARVALFGEVLPALRRRALDAGCQVLDASGDADTAAPLLQIDAGRALPAAAAAAPVLALPGGLSIALSRVLAPLQRAAGLRHVSIATYQSVSVSGRAATEELGRQTVDLLNFREPELRVLPRRIAFNLIPKLGDWLDDGSSTVEARLVSETRRLLGAEAPSLQASCVLVPMFYGFGAAITLETLAPLEPETAVELLAASTGLQLAEAVDAYPTPGDEEAQETVLVGRVRGAAGRPHGLALWLAADELRLSADNAIRILERLVESEHA